MDTSGCIHVFHIDPLILNKEEFGKEGNEEIKGENNIIF